MQESEGERKPKILFYEYRSDDCFSDPLEDSRAGQPGGYRNIRDELRRAGYEVSTWRLHPIFKFNASVDVVILTLGRSSDNLGQQEIRCLQKFIRKGGRVLCLFDSNREGRWDTNLNELVSPFGFRFDDDLLWDQEEKIYKHDWRHRVIISDFSYDHTICEGIRNIWYWGCSISQIEGKVHDAQHDLQVRASNGAYSAIPGTQQIKHNSGIDYVFTPTYQGEPYSVGMKPIVVAAIKIPQTNGRLVMFGGRYVFCNDSIDVESPNLKFDTVRLFLNMIKWLSEELSLKPTSISLPGLITRIWFFMREHKNAVLAIISTIILTLIAEVIIRFLLP